MKDKETSVPAYLLLKESVEIEAVAALSEQDEAFSVSHIPDNAKNWAELLFDGLTFDLTGLSDEKLPIPDAMHQFDLDISAIPNCHMLAVSVGPHISAAGNMPAILRAQMQLLSALCGLPNVLAVGWAPARSVMSPKYFKRVVDNWLSDGPFPALGLTALERVQGPALRSVGLTYITGQEIEVAHAEGEQDIAAKLALRVIDYLVDAGPLKKEQTIKGPGEGLLLLSHTKGDGVVQVLR